MSHADFSFLILKEYNMEGEEEQKIRNQLTVLFFFALL